jgi:hypothetical protein
MPGPVTTGPGSVSCDLSALPPICAENGQDRGEDAAVAWRAIVLRSPPKRCTKRRSSKSSSISSRRSSRSTGTGVPAGNIAADRCNVTRFA